MFAKRKKERPLWWTPRGLDEIDDFRLDNYVFSYLSWMKGDWFDVTLSTEVESVIELVWHVSGLVGNGGFGFLFSGDLNGDPGYIRAEKAFQTIGATEAAAAFQEALGLFEGGRLPHYISVRMRRYESAPEEERERIDLRFFRADTEVVRALADYIRRHRAEVESLLSQRSPIE